MKHIAIFATGLAGLFLASCTTSDFEGFTKADNGLHYKFYTQNEGAQKPQDGDVVLLRFVIEKNGNDSVIANSMNQSRDGSGCINLQPLESTFQGSLEDGLKMMGVGDSAAFIVSADSFFLKTQRMNELPKGFKPGDHIKATFCLKEITPKAEVEARQKKQMEEQEAMMRQREEMAKELEPKEKPAIEEFVKKNKISVKPTESGLYYIETKRGTGANPKETDVVKVHYTGKLLDGTVFDSSIERGEPVEFPLNQVIRGWTEGLKLMKKGGKATLLLPSSIAYGPNGAGDRIPPYSPLLFDVELLDIMPSPEAAQVPAMPGK